MGALEPGSPCGGSINRVSGIVNRGRGVILPRFPIRKGLEMTIDLRTLGARCKKFRVEMGFYQSDVAAETGYSVENVSSFETGRNDNARILLWYFQHGMTFQFLNDKGAR